MADAGGCPRPDCCLRILPAYDGQSGLERGYGKGAPELAVEVSLSSASDDLGPKLRLYRAAGVQEYVNVLLSESGVKWRRLAGGDYTILPADPDGLLRSVVFPGLCWTRKRFCKGTRLALRRS